MSETLIQDATDNQDTTELFARKVEDLGPDDFLAPHEPADSELGGTADTTLQELPLASIEPSQDNPRDLFELERLESLALSIKQHGLLQPILVRRREGYQPGDLIRYIIIAGDRRHRAAKIAGMTTIKALVKEGFVSDRSALVLTLIENLQREQLNAMEAAAGYQQLRDLGYHLERIASDCGVSEEVVSNTIRLLKLPEDVQALISAGKLSRSHGILLLPVLVRMGQMHAVRTEQEEPVIRLANECAEGQWPIKKLGFEIELRFPRPKEATLPLDAIEPTTESKFSEPGPEIQEAEVSEVPGAQADEFVADQQVEMTDEEWETSAGRKPATDAIYENESDDEKGSDEDGSDDEKQAVETEPEHVEEPSADGGSESAIAGAAEVSSESNEAPVADHREGASSESTSTPSGSQPVSVADPAPLEDSAPRPSTPTAKPEQTKSPTAAPPPTAASPAAPALPAGFVTAIVREADFVKAQQMGLWPLAAAIQMAEEAEDQVKAQIDAENPAPASIAMALAGSGASRLAEINATAGTVLYASETQLLDELFPQREATGPDHIVAVLITARLREMTGKNGSGSQETTAKELMENAVELTAKGDNE